jgi:hypothetical protein
MKSQKLTQLLLGKNVRIIATPQKPYPSSLFRYYSDPVYQSTPKETAHQAYHIETQFIKLIHREAESEGVSITEVVNQAFRAYFERLR